MRKLRKPLAHLPQLGFSWSFGTIPRSENVKDEARKAKFLEIANFRSDLLGRFSDSIGQKKEFSLFLGVNKESLATDPIPWEKFTSALRTWAAENCNGQVVIPEHTNTLFMERAVPTRPPRQKRVSYRLKEPSLFRFFNAIEDDEIKPIGEKFLGNASKINKWPKPLGFLGLLPLQLRQEIKVRSSDPLAPASVSRTIFWAGYQVWKARCTKVKRKMSEMPETLINAHQCLNPFHFLPKIANLNSLKIGPCKCYGAFVPHFNRQ